LSSQNVIFIYSILNGSANTVNPVSWTKYSVSLDNNCLTNKWTYR